MRAYKFGEKILVVKNPLLFLTFIYIIYILSHYKRKKTGKLTKNPYKWLNHAGLRVFQNWPKTDHLPTFSDHLPTFSLSKNIKSTAWTEIFDQCPLFLTKNWPQKCKKKEALYTSIKLNINSSYTKTKRDSRSFTFSLH